MISIVEVLNIASTQGLHHFGNTSKLLTRDEHVNVIGHKYIRMYFAVMFIGDFLQRGEIIFSVLIGNEADGTVNPTLDEVLGYACYVDSGSPSDSKRSRTSLICEHMLGDSFRVSAFMLE